MHRNVVNREQIPLIRLNSFSTLNDDVLEFQ